MPLFSKAMSLENSHSTTSIDRPDIYSLRYDSEYSDDDSYDVQPQATPYKYTNALVQALGHPDGDVLPEIGKVYIENSSDVHFGDKNIYHGPVTIKQILYSNGSANLKVNENKTEVNLSSEENSDIVKASERKGNDFGNDDVGESMPSRKCEASGIGKRFLWIQYAKSRPLQIKISVCFITVLFVILTTVLLLRQRDIASIENHMHIISRNEWQAEPPTQSTTPLVTPVQYVVIHHTAMENCSTQFQCALCVKKIQTYHIKTKGWYDIGYNFLVGGDGDAYEGRGWIVEGAHTARWNSKSIGIAFLGTFTNVCPPDIQILTAKKLIKQGVEMGYIKNNYKLLGAKQLSGNTESPGAALLEDLRTWDNWVEEP